MPRRHTPSIHRHTTKVSGLGASQAGRSSRIPAKWGPVPARGLGLHHLAPKPPMNAYEILIRNFR